ncbi:MAG: site-2 protease family protein [Gemmatimonadaceae bacterium]|nr:site-2 protease family protein [Gemmatimonadaceae bacterium]
MDKTQTFLLVAPVLLFSMVAHEYAHGYAALKQGDPTAYQLGRLTWNPMKHIDPFMTIILPILTFITAGVMFGGAKPVPVNPRNYRNFKRGDIIVSLAGVATNLVLAVVAVVAVAVVGLAGRAVPALAASASILQLMLIYGILINLVLAFFNLIPIPPLDGSHVAKYMLPPAWALKYEEFGRYGLIALMVLVMVGGGVMRGFFGPILFVHGAAVRLLIPFILPSPWTV